MKPIKIKLSRDLNSLEIVPFADLHIGDPLCDLNLIKEKIKYVQETENAYAILNGDLMNNTTKNSVGDVYSEKMKPMEQLQTAVELFTPIKHKILCVTFGNHENRSYREDGVDLTSLFCSQLNIDDKYAKESALLFLRFGTSSIGMRETANPKQPRMLCYSLFITHGSGGGRADGGKLNKLAQMASIVDADIYVHSHTHLPMVMKQSFFRTDVRNSTVALVTKLFVNTSSTLDYGGYGEVAEFKPNCKDTPHILLSGTCKAFKANL